MEQNPAESMEFEPKRAEWSEMESSRAE